MKSYTYVTTYVVRAPDEGKAGEVMEKVESQLAVDSSVAEHRTSLIDIEDIVHEQLGWDECTDDDCDYHNDEYTETQGRRAKMMAQQSPTRPEGQDSVGFGKLMGY